MSLEYKKGIKIILMVLICILLSILIYKGFSFGESSGETNENEMFYVNKNTFLYEKPDEDSEIVTEIDMYDAVVIEGEKKDWQEVSYNGLTGWVNKDNLGERGYIQAFNVEIVHENDGNKKESMKKKAVEYNSKRHVATIMNEHNEKIKNNGGDIEGFLKRYPLRIEVRDYDDKGSGGEYHYKESDEGVPTLVIFAYPEHGTITDYILIHEFGHHIGYAVGHPKNDFEEFSKYKDLDIEVEEDTWANDNIEKYAEAHAEAYLDDYDNSTAAGNFKTEKEKTDFIQWEIGKINKR